MVPVKASIDVFVIVDRSCGAGKIGIGERTYGHSNRVSASVVPKKRVVPAIGAKAEVHGKAAVRAAAKCSKGPNGSELRYGEKTPLFRMYFGFSPAFNSGTTKPSRAHRRSSRQVAHMRRSQLSSPSSPTWAAVTVTGAPERVGHFGRFVVAHNGKRCRYEGEELARLSPCGSVGKRPLMGTSTVRKGSTACESLTQTGPRTASRRRDATLLRTLELLRRPEAFVRGAGKETLLSSARLASEPMEADDPIAVVIAALN